MTTKDKQLSRFDIQKGQENLPYSEYKYLPQSKGQIKVTADDTDII